MKVQYSKEWARTNRCGELRAEDEGREVVLNGWVQRRRDLGGLIFIDLRDRAGFVQLVCEPSQNEVIAAAKQIRPEYVIGVKGLVRLRTQDNRNPEMATGDVEVLVQELVLFSEALTPPFEPKENTSASEELRLEYRYLDLRRPSMQANLVLRHVMAIAARNFFNQEGFIEIETPILTKSTPEGARDFLVPSRINKGKFYALPQSPQIYKQLLMIGGLDRYFQIARCFRDEDLRADRQLEFTQIDVEMAFVEPDDIFEIIERLMAGLYQIIDSRVTLPFPVMGYREAMDRFGSDKPDLRLELELVDLSDLVKDSSFKIFSGTVESGGVVSGIAVPGGAGLSRKQLDEAEKVVRTYGAKGLVWVKWGDDGFSGPGAKFLGEEVCSSLFETASSPQGSALLMVADSRDTASAALGALRLHLGKILSLVDEDQLKFLWVVDFPLFEADDEGNPTPVHHPFTAPHPDDLELLESDPLQVRSRAYDVVLNGVEIGGGSIRIHDPDIQQRVFSALNISPQEAREKFGFLLDALGYGAPPHGGIALGFDRMVMLMAGEEAIRNVIAFPKTTSGLSLMAKSPARVDERQLKELGIELSGKD